MQISKIQENFIKSAIKANLRVDARTPFDFRALQIEFLKSGEARVSLGTTKVIASVTSEISTPMQHNPTEGFIFINSSYSPSSNLSNPIQSNIILNRFLEKALRRSGAIDTEGLCIIPGEKVWTIRIFIHVIDHDGNVLDCALLAASAALLHYRRPDVAVGSKGIEIFTSEERAAVPLSVHHVPVAITFSFLDDKIVVDPSLVEEKVHDGSLTVVVNAHGEICTLVKYGTAALDVSVIEQCIEVAAIKAGEVTDIIRNSVAKSYQK